MLNISFTKIGIKCHVCDGDSGCDDPYLEHNGQTITKDEKLVECPATDDMCRKIYQNGKYMKIRQENLTSSCNFKNILVENQNIYMNKSISKR